MFAEPGLKVRAKTWRGLWGWERRRASAQQGEEFPVLPHVYKPALIVIFSFSHSCTSHPPHSKAFNLLISLQDC